MGLEGGIFDRGSQNHPRIDRGGSVEPWSAGSLIGVAEMGLRGRIFDRGGSVEPWRAGSSTGVVRSGPGGRILDWGGPK